MNKDFGHVRHTRNPGNTTMTNQCFMISAPRPAYTFIISPPPYQSHRVRFAVLSAELCQMLPLEHKDEGKRVAVEADASLCYLILFTFV